MSAGWSAFMGGDAVSKFLALLLLAMSVGSWVLIVWRGHALWRATRDVPRALAAFWSASDRAAGCAVLQGLDRERILLPLAQVPAASRDDTLAAQVDATAQHTRLLREALARSVERLQTGQVWLASIGATAPFVGLFGTVWGVYHALSGIGGLAGGEGGLRIEAIAGPVGEALVMTAAGLAVAIPAVLAYNALGQRVSRLTEALEGYAHDLLALPH